MKKITFFAAFFMLAGSVFAGGLLTNTNQSAQFIRMMSRNASTDVDAVYFNPAALTGLNDGWHFAVYNQTIFQTKPVDSDFPLLNDGYYKGEVKVPVFPTAFGVYKMNNWAFSIGFGPNAGGGAATYDRGLPSFEIPITKVVPGLEGLSQINSAFKVSGYDADLSFDGSSVFWGIQLGASYKVSDMFSVYGGVRYLPSKNVYNGTISNIRLKVGDEYHSAPGWLSQVSSQVGVFADAAGGVASQLEPIITGGGGDFTLAQLQGGEFIDAAQRDAIEQGLAGLGVTSPNEMTAQQIQHAFLGAQSQLQGISQDLTATSAQLADKEVETEQTGNGFTPMIGLNFSPADNFNIGIKYEMKTNLNLTNKTEVDDMNLFPDGAQMRNDIPAILAVGLGYNGGLVEAQLSYNMYFNKGVHWGVNTRDMAANHEIQRIREIDRNGMELGLGLQFNVSDNFAFSVGGLYGDMGVAESYQSDFSYTNVSTTAGAGIQWKISRDLALDAGFSNTFYKDDVVGFNDPDVGVYKEKLSKTTMTFAIGLSYSIF